MNFSERRGVKAGPQATAESARSKCAEFSAVWAYTVRGVFERRGVKAGPQATAQAARSGLYAS